jgi:hypothetical protein
LASSAVLLWEMAFCGGECETHNGRHVSSSTPGGIGPLVLCHLPPLSPAGNSFAMGIRLFGASDPRTPRGTRLSAQRLCVSARPLACHFLSALSAYHLYGNGINQGGATKRINRCRRESGLLFQPRFFDRALRTVREYNEKVQYIHLNPVKAGLASHPEDWPWSSVHDNTGSINRAPATLSKLF